MHIPIYIHRILFSFVLLSALRFGAHAQTDGKPMMLHFRVGQADMDSTYADNRATLCHLDNVLADSLLCRRIDSLHIYAFASPDGNRAFNERLARQRSFAVAGYLLQRYTGLNEQKVFPRPQGENWHDLRRLIAADTSLPDREEMLQIIDHTPNSDRCKTLLKRLNGGVPYRHIVQHILPRLRHAAICMVWMKPDTLSRLLPPASPVNNWANASDAKPALTPVPTLQPAARRPLFAVKTNLLFDLAMAPNIELELPIGKRWSLAAEWMFPWWLFEDDKYCFQILSGGLEGRYWLGNRQRRRVLTGHFVGFYAGAGKYDLQWDTDGYQGEFYIASGISYGYALPIGRNLSLEFSLGIGLLKTSYEHYHTLDNYQTLLWQDNGQFTWLGPTKAKISFVWLLNGKTKKGGAK